MIAVKTFQELLWNSVLDIALLVKRNRARIGLEDLCVWKGVLREISVGELEFSFIIIFKL